MMAKRDTEVNFYILRCSACNRKFPAVGREGGKPKECPHCKTGYEYRDGKWHWVYQTIGN